MTDTVYRKPTMGIVSLVLCVLLMPISLNGDATKKEAIEEVTKKVEKTSTLPQTKSSRRTRPLRASESTGAPKAVPSPSQGTLSLARQMFGAGKIKGTSENFNVAASGGHVAPSSGSSENFQSENDFFPEFGCCLGTLGSIRLNDGETDCDDLNDQTVDVADLTNLIDHLFIDFEAICCVVEADFAPLIYGEARDGVTDVVDLTAMIDHLFINFTVLPDCP